MKGVLEGVASVAMGLYLAFRFTTSVIGLSFSGGFFSLAGFYFGSLIVAGAIVCVLTFTRYKKASATLAIGMAMAALVFELKFDSRFGFLFSQWKWMLLPETIFAAAVLTKLKLSEPVQMQS